MEFQEFEKSMVLVHAHRPDPLTYAMLGIGGESGEAVDAYKKALRGTEPSNVKFTPNRGIILLELGDLLWYITRAANELGSSLEDVARLNMRKMELRRQFDKEEGDRRLADELSTPTTM